MPLRRCLDCRTLTSSTRCPACKARRETTRRPSFRARYGNQEAVKRQAVARDGLVCTLCGAPVDGPGQAHLDHVVERRRGGEQTLENSRITCGPCNLGRPRKDLRKP